MKGRAPLPAVGHGIQIGGIFEKFAALDIAADVGQVLKDHAAGPHIGVAHLAIAHLALWQAHVQTGGGQSAAGEIPKDPIQIGGRGIDHCIACRGPL